jgi:hypothetical protein
LNNFIASGIIPVIESLATGAEDCRVFRVTNYIMPEKTSHSNLRRIRQYIADEAERLGKNDDAVVHCVNLDDIDEETHCVVKPGPKDSMEKDLDLLFGKKSRHRKH